MDNPWSSPWTTDDHPPTTKGPSEPAARPFSFPTAAGFEAEEDPTSPWADDGGGDDVWGNWAGGGGRESGADKGEEAETRAEEEMEDLGGSSGSLGSRGLGAAAADRLPSHLADTDPWAGEVSLVGAGAPADHSSNGEDTLEQNAVEESGETDGPDDAGPAFLEPSEPLEPSESPDSSLNSPAPLFDTPTEEDVDSARGASPDITTPARGTDVDVLPVQKHREISSRGTEDARQVSKVQELVVMYDGIAKKSTEPPPPEPSAVNRTPRDGSPKPSEADQDVDDWDEYEDGQQQPPADSLPHAQPPLDPLPDPPPASPEPQPDPARFHIDAASLSILFDGLTGPDAVPPADIPERSDPLDDFSTVSERKAWYRISRQGSSRLHDFGDDDNYGSVSWHGSSVSKETFAIVRRWMQDGAMLGAGRTRAGGVRGSAAAFGWNQSSSSDPVDLSFLKKRRSLESRPHDDAGRLADDGDPGLPNGRPSSMPAAPRGFNIAPPPGPAPAPAKRPSPLVFSASQEESGGDDEEWGDMVSPTPFAASSPPALVPDPGPDSAVSFGRPESGSSLDGRPVAEIPVSEGAGRRRPERDGRDDLKSEGSAQPRMSLEHGGERRGVVRPPTEARSSTDTTASGDARETAGEMGAVARIIARLPDLSYMLR